MKHLLHTLEARLAALPVPMAVELPAGRHVGAAYPAVTLRFRDRMALVALASGDIGHVGASIVEGRVALEGGMRDLMAAAAGLLTRDPARDQHHGWWQRVWARARSMAAHTLAHDARQVRLHYELSDDFYALWLDRRRVYSCAYYRSPGLTLAAAQEARLDHICRKLQLQPGERFLDIGAGLGRPAAVGGRTLRGGCHRHHAVMQPARACAAADRRERAAGPGAHAAGGLSRAAGGTTL